MSSSTSRPYSSHFQVRTCIFIAVLLSISFRMEWIKQSRLVSSGKPLYRILRHLIYWCFWLSFYGVVNASYHQTSFYKWFLFELLTMVIKVPYTYFLAYWLFPRFIQKRKYISIVVNMIFFAFLGMVLLSFLYQLFPYEMPGGATEFLSVKTLYMFTDLIYIASPVVLIKMTQNYIQQERNAARLNREKIEAELKALKSQIQPHFLFNNLNNIYSLVISKDELAASSLLRLSDILSYMLYECNVEKVSLAKEIQMIQHYIELEKIRYGDELDISFDCRGDSSGHMIAPLLLLPFIENAFKHGVLNCERRAWIRLCIYIADNEFTYLVENSLPATIPPTTGLTSGIGLQNIQQRLTLLYPEKHQIFVQQSDSYLIKFILQL